MNFNEIAARFEASESGTQSFGKLYKAVFELMRTDPENAALYFVIGIAARAYVRKYEDQDVEPHFADSVKARFVIYNAKLRSALDADASARLRLAGELATHYEWQVSEY